MAIINSQEIISAANAAAEEILATTEEGARVWRDQELLNTDWIIPITDHPERASYLAYRTNLRDWPTTDAFPDTKPTL